MRLKIIISAVFLMHIPASQADTSQACFQRLRGFQLPFEFYIGATKDKDTHVQRPPVPSYGADVHIAPLCNGNVIAVWLPRSYGRSAAYLTGRIFDSEFKAVTADFRITENDESQWEHSLSTLYDRNFVVTWKTNSDGGTTIRARIFSSSGAPRGPSFDVSLSPNQNARAKVMGLANKGFIVAWASIQRQGVVFRRFENTGRPKSSEVLVAKYHDQWKWLVPYPWVTDDGSISIFMRQFYASRQQEPFNYGRRYDVHGEPLTEVLTGPAMSQLVGYQEAVEFLVTEGARSLAYRLREFLQRKHPYCGREFSSDVVTADKMKLLTKDGKKKEFFTRFCQQRSESCGIPKLLEAEHKRCAGEE